MTQPDATIGAAASPARTEREDDEFDTYWNNLVGEHEVWVPYYEDYVQFWKLGEVVTDEDGRDWVLDRHREVYVPIPPSTAAWLRFIRKARYGEQEAGKKASMSPETEWGTPPPDELIHEGFQAWTESPVAAPKNVSTHTSAASAAAEHYYDDGELEYAEELESLADYSSDELEYAGDSGDSYGGYAPRTCDDPEYSGSEYSVEESDYVENEYDQAGEERGAGYASSAQGCASEEDEHVPRTVTYEFEIKIEDEDDDYALLHPGSPRPDAAMDALNELLAYLNLPDDEVPATGNDSA